MSIITVANDSEWNTLLTDPYCQDKLLVVQISAKWCGPCKRIAPLVEKLTLPPHSLNIVKIDCDEAENNLFEFGMAETVPTFRFVRNGQVLGTYVDSNIEGLLEQVRKYT